VASTRIPEIEQAIVEAAKDGIKGAGLADKVEVGSSLEPKSAQYLWLYKSETNREFLGLGRRPPKLREDIRCYLRLYVTGGGQYDELKARCYELLEVVETALRDRYKLDDSVEFSRIVKAIGEPISLDQRSGYHILFQLVGKTRI
jgi:hypothetical protein